MRELSDHLEIFISDDDVDEDWQLRDLGSVMRPYHEQTRAIDKQMVEALEDAQ
jgi:hypothetical protein